MATNPAGDAWQDRAIRCITFDLDDTLWACAPVILRAEQAMHAWFGDLYPAITQTYTLEDLRAQRQALMLARPDLRHDMTAVRRASLQALADEFGYPVGMVEAGIEYFIHHRNQVEFFDDAIPTLTRLQGRYRIGAITNGNAELSTIGADHLFDFIITSAATGVGKPQPRIFERALEAAQAAPGQTVHVGDDPDSDILGAGRAGLRTVWVNPDGVPWPGGQHPDAVIRSLGELEAILARWD